LAKIKGFSVLLVISDINGKAEVLNTVQTRGYTTKVVTDEFQAIEQAKKDFDVIIIHLKDSKSYDLLLKMKKVVPRIVPFIGIGSKEDTDAPQKCKEFEVEYLQRPIEIKTFLTTVDDLVSLSQETAYIIDVNVAIEQSGDDLDFLIELIELFIAEGKKEILVMEEALEKGDAEALDYGAHSMKGAAAQIAAKPLSRACYLLEDAAKKKNSEKFKQFLELIKKRFLEFEEKAKNRVKNFKK